MNRRRSMKNLYRYSLSGTAMEFMTLDTAKLAGLPAQRVLDEERLHVNKV